MGLIERIIELRNRLATYSPWEVGVELLVIWLVVYLIVRFVQGTRAAGAMKGLLFVLIAVAILSRVLAGSGSFQRLGMLYDKLLALVALSLIVIFQPELRRALVRLGETSFLRATPKDIKFVVSEVGEAVRYLSRAKFGALIVIERQTKVAGVVEGGTALGAALSARLLQTLFFPGSALHDLACVVRGKVIDSAGVQLPLADPQDMPDPKLGSRHRAAVGLSQECDALVIVVSEESGAVRIAERGKLYGPFARDQVEAEIEGRLTRAIEAGGGRGAMPAAAEPAEPATTAAQQQETDQLHDTMMDSIAGLASESGEQRQAG